MCTARDATTEQSDECPLEEYDCGDMRCQTHHINCNQDLGPGCWHSKRDCEQHKVEGRKTYDP